MTGALLVAGVADGVQEDIGRRNAIGAIDDRAVLADDEDGAVDLFPVHAGLAWNRFERAVFARELQTVIDQQIER
jgi:hypothetical protein